MDGGVIEPDEEQQQQQPLALETASCSVQNVPSATVYAIIRNIPKAYHAKHLRYYFSDYVENGWFHCFHYRHRPEIHVHDDGNEPTTSRESKRFCCVVSFRNEKDREAFIRQYHRKFWIDDEGHEIPLKCFIFPLKNDEASQSGKKASADLDFRSLIELKPPSLMPGGNVGTPTKYFLEQIRLCKLPPSILSKLGIKAKRRIGKYGAVHLSYSGTEEDPVEVAKGSPHLYVTAVSENKPSVLPDLDSCSPEELTAKRHEPDNDDGPDDDDDQCEEWERHEALHDDVTEQERTKPKKYEEEQEVTWEKGGPGLVWHTDTFFWKELEEGTDSDWKWADDWDIDYSIYYDRKEGDLDAKQAVEMLEDQKLRTGEISHSVFEKKEIRKRCRESQERPSSAVGFGQFETHTRGIGSKIMKRYGWSPGAGLGAHSSGRLETVSVEMDETDEAQNASERKGLGYRGEKLQRTGFFKPSNHIIATKYDKKNIVGDDDSARKVLRREEPTFMKYR